MIDRNLFLCKAKTIDESEWIYGYYVYHEYELKPKHYIITSTIGATCKSIINNMTATAFEVDPNTICRCTGMKDINGNLIYEHDICKRYISDFPNENGTICWNVEDGSFVWKHYNVNTNGYDELYIDEWGEAKIIGNEFNNSQERILCSAVKFTLKNKENPVIITGYRHGDCLQTLCYFIDVSEIIADEQGFLTSKGRFVNRIEAKQIAKKESQLIRTSPYKALISEDLY